MREKSLEIRPASRELLLDGEFVDVGPRALDLLVALSDRRDRVVSKDGLLELVWPNLFVEENNVEVHISALRRLMGRRAIATIPGRGYRFTATLADDGGRAGARREQAGGTDIPSGRELRTNLPDMLFRCSSAAQTSLPRWPISSTSSRSSHCWAQAASARRASHR